MNSLDVWLRRTVSYLGMGGKVCVLAVSGKVCVLAYLSLPHGNNIWQTSTKRKLAP